MNLNYYLNSLFKRAMDEPEFRENIKSYSIKMVGIKSVYV